MRTVTNRQIDLRTFITGSDARIVMSDDRESLVRLWREKRGEVLPLEFSNDLVAQLGSITQHLHKKLYESASGHTVREVRRPISHAIHKWMRADVTGRVQDTGAVFFTRFLPSGNFFEADVTNAHMAQLQHSMWVMAARVAVLSIITGDGKWVKTTVPADPLYQHLLLTAEKKFLRCVQTGEPPCLLRLETPNSNLGSIGATAVLTSNQ